MIQLGGPVLDREEIRRRLTQACGPARPGQTGKERLAPGVPAAVLIGVVARPDGPRIVLTQRTAHLSNHPAEISFPGGHIEETDAGPEAAALREAYEEVGLDPASVEVLGCLATYRTVTDFCVSPVVGWIEPPVDFVPDAHEVAEIFEVPLAYVLDPANHKRDSIFFDGRWHGYYVLPYMGRRIWGATAGMLVDLARTLDVRSGDGRRRPRPEAAGQT